MGVRGVGGLSVRAKALSVEIAVTEDDMICKWGNCRCWVRFNWVFDMGQLVQEGRGGFVLYFLVRCGERHDYVSARGGAGI